MISVSQDTMLQPQWRHQSQNEISVRNVSSTKQYNAYIWFMFSMKFSMHGLRFGPEKQHALQAPLGALIPRQKVP